MAGQKATEIDSGAERELIARVAAGDEAAFEILYERYFPRVYHFASRRLGNRADAEETAQETFINIFSSIESDRGEAPFAAWVLGVARRTLAGRFKKKRHPTVPLEGREEPESIDLLRSALHREPTPLEHYECGERLARLDDAARHQLSEEQRNLFVMHHLHHQSIQDIARSLHKSEDAVKSNLYRARKLLLTQ